MSAIGLIEKLPLDWRGLFSIAFKSNSFVLNRMEEWYQDHTSSQYGGRLNWDDLIHSLVAEEPKSTTDGLVLEVSL